MEIQYKDNLDTYENRVQTELENNKDADNVQSPSQPVVIVQPGYGYGTQLGPQPQNALWFVLLL